MERQFVVPNSSEWKTSRKHCVCSKPEDVLMENYNNVLCNALVNDLWDQTKWSLKKTGKYVGKVKTSCTQDTHP